MISLRLSWWRIRAVGVCVWSEGSFEFYRFCVVLLCVRVCVVGYGFGDDFSMTRLYGWYGRHGRWFELFLFVAEKLLAQTPPPTAYTDEDGHFRAHGRIRTSAIEYSVPSLWGCPVPFCGKITINPCTLEKISFQFCLHMKQYIFFKKIKNVLSLFLVF